MQRLDNREALASLRRYRFQQMPPQKVTDDADDETEQEGCTFGRI
jgi:hypothetical protein